MNNVEHIQNSLLDGGNLSLNFINTIKDRLVADPIDYLTGKEEWITWLKHVDILENETSNFDEASFNLKEVIRKREFLHRVFQGLVFQREIKEKDLKCFDTLLQKIRRSTKIFVVDNKPQEHLEIDPNDLNSYILKIGKAAHELLMSEEIDRVKECGNCGWIYFDSSKNRCRKWCNMDTCGNEVKARKYYESKKNKV
ncbi:putative RNA-binding Zn ribbon-like protein [Aquimarina sp. EL_43]|uniref:CGNR zinc finger domain-containing protein n=1 Tax=unclassified Aquimarina TaxID=2627091 RepID=UPI0018C93842|nr:MULTISPECIES: CGNR zinc finger domain-containing protein [unclassified Aquimarina]MBG6133432.1 putative RNA-binding Zn ribbon-like protein [Aquimarina sp. EL_35]MBG6153590.1 putative RNA-binding Zn ribbon-like protein [Aquimarina sp. EL_32]MBG6171746.1 putative RNA-binding Zn ribbon-like protein [Aquimarina sp. EL_43]